MSPEERFDDAYWREIAHARAIKASSTIDWHWPECTAWGGDSADCDQRCGALDEDEETT